MSDAQALYLLLGFAVAFTVAAAALLTRGLFREFSETQARWVIVLVFACMILWLCVLLAKETAI